MSEGLPETIESQRQLRDRWSRLMKQTVDADEWGQTLEAMEGYARLLNLLNSSNGAKQGSQQDHCAISSVRKSIDSRLGYLKTGDNPIPIKELKGILANVDRLFINEGPEEKFPISPISSIKQSKAQAETTAATTHSSPSTKVRLLIQQIGLKDAATYNEPRIVVSVVDASGKLLAPTDSTPVSTQRSQSYIVFQKELLLPVRYEDLGPGCAIVFEFKHLKVTPIEKLSTKCWTFMDLDEIQPEKDIALELYKKPTDLQRKRLKLHTIKRLYLHLRLTFDSGFA